MAQVLEDRMNSLAAAIRELNAAGELADTALHAIESGQDDRPADVVRAAKSHATLAADILFRLFP